MLTSSQALDLSPRSVPRSSMCLLGAVSSHGVRAGGVPPADVERVEPTHPVTIENDGDYDEPGRSAYSTLRNGHSAAIQSPTLRHNGTSRSARLARTHESTLASCSLSRTG